MLTIVRAIGSGTVMIEGEATFPTFLAIEDVGLTKTVTGAVY